MGLPACFAGFELERHSFTIASEGEGLQSRQKVSVSILEADRFHGHFKRMGSMIEVTAPAARERAVHSDTTFSGESDLVEGRIDPLDDLILQEPTIYP